MITGPLSFPVYGDGGQNSGTGPDGNAGTSRVKNVNSTQFDIGIVFDTETTTTVDLSVSWIVCESGDHTTSSGLHLKVGT